MEQPEIPFNFETCTPFVMRHDIDDLTEEMKSIKAKNLNSDFKIQELEKKMFIALESQRSCQRRHVNRRKANSLDSNFSF